MSLVLFAVMAFAIGFALSLSGPIVVMLALGEHGKGLGKKFWSIGMTSVWRPAITINDVGDLLLKRRSYNDDLNREEVNVGGTTRELEDPQDRLHHFYGIPFGFVDEIFGVVFDPRDADAAARAKERYDNSELVYAEQSERGYYERVRAFFELPEGDRATGLAPVRHLVGGGNDASAAERVVEHYRKSQSPRSSTSTIGQMLVPLAGFLAVVFAGWFAYSQTGGGGGSAPQGSSETVGYLLLLLSAPQFSLDDLRERLSSYWETLKPKLQSAAGSAGDRADDFELPVADRVAAVVGGLAVIVLAVEVVLAQMMPVVLLVVLNLAFIAGFVFLPALAHILGRSLGPIGVALGQLYLIMGLLAYDKPVVYLNERDEYELKEAAGADLEHEAVWYRFAKSWLGVAYENTEDAWPGADTTMSPRKVKAYGGALADGGEKQGSSSLPKGYAKAETLSYAGHQGFVPEDPSSRNVHVQTHHVLSWFRDACRGETLQRAHQYAKDKYGGGEKPMSDRTVILMTVLMVVLGIAFDYIAFFS